MNFDDPASSGSGWFGCEGTQGIYALIEAPFDATSSHHRRQRRTERHARRLTPGGAHAHRRALPDRPWARLGAAGACGA